MRRAEAEIDAIDLVQRRVAVGTLSFHGARLAVRPDIGAPLPLLDGIAFAPPPPSKQRRPQPRCRPPWRRGPGRSATLATPFARLHVAGSDGEIVLAASMSGESLGPGAYWSPVRAWVGRGGGVAVFDGTARMTRGLLLDGRLTANDLDVPAFARALGVPYAELAQTGHGKADLALEIEPGAAKEPPLDVRGQITLSGVSLAGPAGDDLALGADAIDLKLAGIDLVRGDDGAVVTTSVRFSDAALRSPYALFTRTPEGWLLPAVHRRSTRRGSDCDHRRRRPGAGSRTCADAGAGRRDRHARAGTGAGAATPGRGGAEHTAHQPRPVAHRRRRRSNPRGPSTSPSPRAGPRASACRR